MAYHTESVVPDGVLEGVAKAEPYTPTDEEKQLLGRFDTLWRNAQQEKSPKAEDWAFYQDFLKGNQVFVRDRSSSQVLRLSLSKEDAARLFSVENRLRPVARALVGKLTRIIPTFEVVPATSDAEDFRAAEMATTFLDFITRTQKLRVKYLRGTRDLCDIGTAPYYLNWNVMGGRWLATCPQCGYEGDESEEGQPCPSCQAQFEAEAQQQTQERQMMAQQMGATSPPPEAKPQEAPQLVRINEGEVDVQHLNPFDYYPEPGVSDYEKLRWAIVAEVVPISKIRQDFPEKGIYVTPDAGLSGDRHVVFSGAYNSSDVRSTDYHEHARVKYYHQVATSAHPDGRLVVIAGNVVLHDGPHPTYKLLGRLPFFYNWFERTRTEFWGEPPVEQAWRLQHERNTLRKQMRAHRNLLNRPRLLEPIGNQLGVDEIDEMPGRVLKYNAMAGKPTWLEAPPMPNFVMPELESMDAGIRDQFGVTEHEMGMSGSDQSGRYAAILEAQSSESISPILVENNQEWLELYRGILILAQHFYTEDRVWHVHGRGRVHTYTWRDMNLRPGWDVVLSTTDSLSSNKALRLDQAERLLQNQVFTDPNTGQVDIRSFLRMAGIAVPQAAPDLSASERAYAATIPDMILEGRYQGPRPWDDAYIHVEELGSWLRGPGREQDPALQQAVGQVFMFFVQQLQAMPVGTSFSPGAQMQQAPGGQPQQPGQQGASAPGNVQSEAEQGVAQADQQAEQAAKGSQPHEA